MAENKLRRKGDIDPRTKLLTRSALESRVRSSFNECIIKCDLDNTPPNYSVILFDIDYFKAINDLFSHKQGDTVLKKIGEILRTHKSEKDYVGLLARWGGEEFVLALPYSTSEKAKLIADDLRKRIAQYEFRDIKTRKTLKEYITISLGIDTIDLADTIDRILREKGEKPSEIASKRLEKLSDKELLSVFHTIVNKADYALDYAKFMGRNRIEIFEEYLLTEMENLELVRKFYFNYSLRNPSELKPLFESEYLTKNKDVKERMEKQFDIIKLKDDEQAKKEFIDFVHSF